MTTEDPVHLKIREVLAQYGKMLGDVWSLGAGDDLFRAGLASHASVNVMLGLEDAFDVEFPDALLTRATFESIDAMAAALRSLLVAGAPA